MSGSTRTVSVTSDAWRQTPTVLVVDDDASVLDGLSELFEGEGYGVATARDGWSALEQLRGGLRPSVIVLDLMMPAMDGWDFRQEQLRDAILKDIPVVLFTAAGFSETSTRLQFGDIEFVAKPPAIGELLGAIRRRIGNLTGHRPKPDRKTHLPHHILIVDDDRALREVLADLLVEKGYDVSVATNGREAFDICRAQRPPDLIFLDLRMPTMDGLEFTRLKDADPQLSQVPVCVMTAFAASVSIPPTSSVVLRKPLGSADLFAVVKRFCPAPPT